MDIQIGFVLAHRRLVREEGGIPASEVDYREVYPTRAHYLQPLIYKFWYLFYNFRDTSDALGMYVAETFDGGRASIARYDD